MKIILIYLFFINSLFAQELWDVQYSVNDIQHQRNLFSETKIKKITVDNQYWREEIIVSEDGKINSKNTIYDFGSTLEEYRYSGVNLIEINDFSKRENADYQFVYDYDEKGNVSKRICRSGVVDFYSYDNDNNLLSTVVIESVDACDYPMVGDTRTMSYKYGKLVEVKWNCYDDTYNLTRFFYDDMGRISNELEITAKCSNDSETVTTISKYIYKGISQLPEKITIEGNDISYVVKLNYEYYN